MKEKMSVDVAASVRWQKENGRLVPADKKEVAAARTKTFICPKCHQEIQKKHVAFGETVMCKCGGVMREKTNM